MCKKCKKSKPLEEFVLGKRYKGGFRPICKVCHNIANSKWRKDNPNYFKERYLNDVEYYARKKAEWRAANPEYQMDYYENNKDLVLSLHHKYRARKNKAFVEYVNREKVLYRDSGVCHICKRTVDINNWHLDHVIPLNGGGEHSYTNVAVSHPHCNSVKRDRMGDIWQKKQI